MNAQEIIKAINESDINTIDEIFDINRCLKQKHEAITIRMKNKYMIGDEVNFNYKGETITGMIEKINKKTISIKSHDKRSFRVSPQFLNK